MDPRPPSSPLRVLMRPTSVSSASPPATVIPTPSTSAAANLHTPPFSSTSSSSSSAPPLPPKSAPPPSPPEGVVVVGFVGGDAVHLINRILDANAFGSGGLDTNFPASATVEDGGNDWFRLRRVSYFLDSEKGIVFLHITPSRPGRSPFLGDGDEAFDLRLEEQECDDMRGMLFMFSVCHVIILLHEGSRFDTRLLQKFRLLQTAKTTISPFIRSQFTPHTAQNRNSPSISQPSTVTATSRSPGRIGSGRHGSSVSSLSSAASHPMAIPGHCVPVLLFVFLDEFPDGISSSSNAEDPVEALVNQPSSSGAGRLNLSVKGTGPVMVLARPSSKLEASFRKRLQSLLDSQIRFLMKKCRVLVGAESGPRGSGNTASLPLFMLDPSRAMVLLNKSANCRGKSLDFVTDLIDDILNSKATPDVLTPETLSPGSSIEDFQTIKDFIYRQCESFRGRGSMPPATTSGSGVGMVAAAAAAAAASTAGGKPITAPKLPSLENWVSSSKIVLHSLVSVKRQPLDKIGLTRRTPVRKSVSPVTHSGVPSTGIDELENAISCLESGRGLNHRFSMSWCQRALPAAKEIYLKDLPPCYPTALHKSQLEKSLHAFQLKVKGPAAQIFAKKLEEECTDIWSSGRQLCDAISLTGKPCMHQRHEDSTSGLPVSKAKQHCSGFVFLHACACGRSRRLRDDPFDFESANLSFNCFPSCESNLPTFEPLKGILPKPLDASWSLVRLGGERYYDPVKGLLQSGFCDSDKYLFEWRIVVGQPKETSAAVICKESPNPKTDPTEISFAEIEKSKEISPKKIVGAGKENQKDASTQVSNINFGKGFPLTVLKKAFSEVVAGTANVDRTSSLQLQSQMLDASEKGSTGRGPQNKAEDQSKHTCGTLRNLGDDNGNIGNPSLQIGSNVVPVNMQSSGKSKTKSSLNDVSIYIGFEHECPRGHRFLLSEDHLSNLGSLYSSSEWRSLSDDDKSTPENEKHMYLGKKSLSLENNTKKKLSSFELAQNFDQIRKPISSRSVGDREENHRQIGTNDGGHALSLLQRDLPIYMNCPHCRHATTKNLPKEKVNFASTVSQLQRIFLVTPSFPLVLATCPVVQFDESRIGSSISNCRQNLQFNIGCRVILPPESFLTLRLPFVYGGQLQDGSLQALNYTEQQPELTAWLVKGTALEIVSKD